MLDTRSLLTSLRTPAPAPVHVSTGRTYFPTLDRYLTHEWIDGRLATAKASKADDAGIPVQMWDLRITKLFPRLSVQLAEWGNHLQWTPVNRPRSSLGFLRHRLMGVLRRKVWKELRVHLTLMHGPKWCETLLDIRRAVVASRRLGVQQRSPVTPVQEGRKRARGESRKYGID